MLANSKDPDENPQNLAFHQSALFADIKQSSPTDTEVHLHLEILVRVPFICTVSHPMVHCFNIQIVFISKQRVKG